MRTIILTIAWTVALVIWMAHGFNFIYLAYTGGL